MHRLAVGLIGSLSLAGLPGAAEAQFPPERTKNLKVLPMDIPIRALVDTMAGFTRALGVRCTYCHVGRDGEPLATYDFAADEKPEKAKAREMLRMVTAINSEHLVKLATRRQPRIAVTCATCHHGLSQPRPLQQILLIAYDAGGADSVAAAYSALRQRYYGSAAYDFGEVPLVDVANKLREQNHLADALRLYLLNTEVSPNSGFAFRMAADGQLAAGDTAAAVASLRRAVAINANDRQATRALEQLVKKPPQGR